MYQNRTLSLEIKQQEADSHLVSILAQVSQLQYSS